MRMKREVRFRVSGLSVEKLLNEARKKGIFLCGIRREKSREISATASPRAYGAFRALAEEKGYQVGPERAVGLLRLERGLLRRTGLLLGGVLAAGLLVWALGFVWQVRVENAGPYLGEVRAYLEELGVRPGIRRSRVALSDLREKLEWRLPQVKWVKTEWAGVVLRVRLEEGAPPPEIESAGEAADVVAGEDGILTRLITYAGTPQAKAGDFVRAGQVLIRGEERGEGGQPVPVKARGEAVARLWVSVRARVPGWRYASVPTGRQGEARALWTPFYTWPSHPGPDYLTADRTVRHIPVGGAWLPVVLVREEREEAALERESRSLEEMKREGAGAALSVLNRALLTDEIVDKWINCAMIEGDTMIVTATAEVLRSIGRRQAR